MSEEKEGPGFTVKDRRIFSPDREEEPTKEEPRKDKPEEPREPETKAEGKPEEEADREIPLPDPSFSTFLEFFFFQQAMLLLGEIPNAETKGVTKNLPMAKYLIDTLAIIKEKTSGNLTSEEQTRLDTFLTELRMRYVKALGG